ncbi:LIFR factor, partial [Atractosteus spatula]|nr:LIFR factor [Atractosteus spatula]
ASEPLTPTITELYAESYSRTLVVKWNISSLGFEDELNVTFEIQVARTEDLDVLHTDWYSVMLKKGKAVFTWQWVSEVPLECEDHSVRIRSILNDTYSSSWSSWVKHQGKHQSDEPEIFPYQEVLKEGSTAYFCCIASKGENVTTMKYNHREYPMLPISNRTKAIKVENLPLTGKNGIFVTCNEHHIVIFVSFPPEKPQNVRCETRDLETVNCTWHPGKDNLSLGRKQKYSLITGPLPEDEVACSSNSYCAFKIVPGQQRYNTTVKVKNRLGVESVNLTVDITHIVFPKPPVIQSTTPGPRSVNISWTLEGNFSAFKLLCQIITNNGDIPMVCVFLHQDEPRPSGKHLGTYEVSVDGLHPYTRHKARVRCAASEHFWKWSEWSEPQDFQTEAVRPSVAPDLWRDIKDGQHSRNVTVLWKKYPVSSESRGPIHSYSITWEVSGRNEQEVVSSEVTQKEIAISKDNCTITVRASNAAGSSPASRLIIPAASWRDGNHPEVQKIHGRLEGFWMELQRDPRVDCGYAVEWCELPGATPCALEWRKIPFNTTFVRISSGKFTAGQRYTFRVYGCSSDTYWLLERKMGYTSELAPREQPSNLQTCVSHSSVTLKWDFSENSDYHPGFIKGYQIHLQDSLFCLLSGSQVFNVTNATTKEYTIPDLLENREYTITVAAFTAAGLGPQAVVTVITPRNHVQFLVILLTSVLVLVLLVVVLCVYLWPRKETVMEIFLDFFRVPTPKEIKALQWDNSIYETTKKLQGLTAQDCPCCKIEIVETKQEEKLLMHLSASELESPLSSSPHTVCSYCLQDTTTEPAQTSENTPGQGEPVNFNNLTYLVEMPDMGGQSFHSGLRTSPILDGETRSQIKSDTGGYITTGDIPQ